MTLKFIFLGKKTPKVFYPIIDNYINRLNKYIRLDVIFVNERNENKLEQKILKHIRLNSCFIVLDEKGKLLDTLRYTQLLQKKMENNSLIIFLVGSAYGVPKKIIDRSDHVISISNMTFPHLIARLILIEQTYRSFTILNNHPYHHE